MSKAWLGYPLSLTMHIFSELPLFTTDYVTGGMCVHVINVSFAVFCEENIKFCSTQNYDQEETTISIYY